MTKTWCVGARHKSNTNNNIEHEKVNPRTERLKNWLKLQKVLVVFLVAITHKFLLSK